MPQLSLQQQIALRKALKNELVNIEGIARRAVLKKNLVVDFASGKPALSSMQLTALQQAVRSLHSDTKTMLSELERQKTVSEAALENLKAFLSKYDISLEAFLQNDADALHQIQAWISGQGTFPAKLMPIIKRSLLQLSSELAL